MNKVEQGTAKSHGYGAYQCTNGFVKVGVDMYFETRKNRTGMIPFGRDLLDSLIGFRQMYIRLP